MEAMIKAFQEKGLQAPEGLVNLIRKGSSRRTIYRALWAAAKFGSGLGGQLKTYVFPHVLREAVRERFPSEDAGEYDSQYEGRGDVYYISLDELVEMPYPKKVK